MMARAAPRCSTSVMLSRPLWVRLSGSSRRDEVPEMCITSRGFGLEAERLHVLDALVVTGLLGADQRLSVVGFEGVD